MPGQDSCESTLLVGSGFENKGETGKLKASKGQPVIETSEKDVEDFCWEALQCRTEVVTFLSAQADEYNKT